MIITVLYCWLGAAASHPSERGIAAATVQAPRVLVVPPSLPGLRVSLSIFVFIISDRNLVEWPPHTWKYPNVPILTAVGFIPIFWWATLFCQLMPLFQGVYGWSAIVTAVRFLPTGILGGAIAGPNGSFPKYFSPKWCILGGLFADGVGTIMLALANTIRRYWSIMFPASMIGTIGNMVLHANSSIAIFQNTPPDIAGTTGHLQRLASNGHCRRTCSRHRHFHINRPGVYHPREGSSTTALQTASGLSSRYSSQRAVALLIWYQVDKPAVGDVEAKASEDIPELEGKDMSEKVQAMA